jgi:hypothetical protein
MKKLLVRVSAMMALALPVTALAQTTGILQGHVYDQSGTAIRGVTVSISSPTQIGGTKTVVTNDEGVFRVVGLTPGTFTVTVSAPRLKSVVQNGVRVQAASTAEIDILMEVETAEEQVRIVEKAPTVNTTKATVGESFDLDFVNNLPLGTRDFQGVAALTPGVQDNGSGNPSVRGGTFFNNTYTVDGFQTTDPVTHTFTENFAFDAMNTVQVQTAAVGAEHSDTLGGITNIVTRSGSNRLEVEASGTYQDQNLQFFKDARDIGENRLVVASVSVGGPIQKDRIWFFLTAQGVSNASTLPRDPAFPDHPSFKVLGFSGSGKLTWQITPRNKLEFTTRYEPGDFNNVIQDPSVEPEAEARQIQVTRFVGLQWHSALTDNIALVSRAGINQNYLDVGPQSCRWDPAHCTLIPGVQDLSTGILRQNYISQSKDSRQTVELSGSAEYFADSRRLGSHGIRLGVRYLAASAEIAQTVPGDEVLFTAGPNPISRSESCSNDPKNDNGACHHNWLFSEVVGSSTLAALSDDWKPTRYLTLTPEVALHIGHSKDDKSAVVTDITAVTPHLQAVWDPTHDGRTAIRGSFSNVVDTGFLALAQFTSRQPFSKRCDWDPSAMAYVRNCRSSGGDSSQTVGLPCGPDGLNPDGTSCRTALRAPRVWEATVGAEREIVTGVSMGIDYIYRRFVHQWEDLETNGIWNEGGTGLRREGSWKNGRPQFVFDLETPDAARRVYHSVTATARKREGLLRMNLSYTWTLSEGATQAGFATLFLDNPGQAPYWYGPLSDDHRHDVRAQISYQLKPWVSVGAVYQFLSGGPYNRFFFDPTFGTFSAFHAQRGYDTRGNLNPDDDTPLRLPDRSSLDIQGRFNLRPLIGQPIEVFADVFNILSLRTTTSVFQTDGPFWGRPTGRTGPTSARLGLQFRFR